MKFIKVQHRGKLQQDARNSGVLYVDNWDDYGYKTKFVLVIVDGSGVEHRVGDLKIAYQGQSEGWTEHGMPDEFTSLEPKFFSLGQDVEYYRKLLELFSLEEAHAILHALGDVAFSKERREASSSELAFSTSLLRAVNPTTIDHQFKRILTGDAPLTPYDFFYEKARSDGIAPLTLEFSVDPDVKPSSNVHILIGRNGVGKTTLLNGMVDSLVTPSEEVYAKGCFFNKNMWSFRRPLTNDDFAGVVSVSFSAFDPFDPPPNQDDPSQGMRYRYVGLKHKVLAAEGEDVWGLKTKPHLCIDLADSLKVCLSLSAKRARWIKAIHKLESDFNFEEMNLIQLIAVFDADGSETKAEFVRRSTTMLEGMSSGHAIVLLTITQLVETVDEKTLVLIDEPESHLHPPLLSAFTRALSDLLTARNAVAIIATHSPVVLQEVPKSCVSIINRSGETATIDRPDAETFAENVGVLTRHVFGLEVSKSGFHELLAADVRTGAPYEQIRGDYAGQIGTEGQALLRSMTIARDKQWESDL
ncbi:AAA family ATPase [Pseudomonas bijieensis]|uniref:ATP-binding protein n=1 Tax=Pseudomonas bijieensis TaxID=2681983 RepID=A0A6N1C914_9PSED|nr:AAA family ATPase [Pseudomonas bijieensis]QKS80965.1 ATP-binding protein [Pseudomonas bijieensis]